VLKFKSNIVPEKEEVVKNEEIIKTVKEQQKEEE
jgi:hypothetical protein